MSVNYDNLAPEYINYRVPDSRIAAAIAKHFPRGAAVLNIGAGQGAYEPVDCDVTSIEPSWEMITRRAATNAKVIQGCAEQLPFDDDSFDMSMAVLTIHHWQDFEKGISEIKRVTRNKAVILTWSPEHPVFWLSDYFPEIDRIDAQLFPSMSKLTDLLEGNTEVEIIEVPQDCSDGFMCAYWRRPEMYLNAAARQAISTFSRLSDVDRGLEQLQNDLASGMWVHKNAALLSKNTLDCGYRLVVVNIASKTS
tara:strand:- start:4631 stop:5383 length:753 start_codon:yes stop_codon:yes gene_type:complete